MLSACVLAPPVMSPVSSQVSAAATTTTPSVMPVFCTTRVDGHRAAVDARGSVWVGVPGVPMPHWEGSV